VWVFATMESVFYIYRSNREAGFLAEMLRGFDGVVVSDFYAGYESLPCRQQRCLIHLIRDINGDLRKDQFNKELGGIAARFGELLRPIIATIDKYGLKRRHLNKHLRDTEKFYEWINASEYETEIASHYQKRLVKNQERLFEFLRHDNVPWNNNNAENAIKPFAKYRESAKEMYTKKSLNDHLIVLSVQQTCKYRVINFLDFMKSAKRIIE